MATQLWIRDCVLKSPREQLFSTSELGSQISRSVMDREENLPNEKVNEIFIMSQKHTKIND